MALLVFGTVGLSTTFADLGTFWKGYVLDMTGPAWNYILFRGRYRGYVDNTWTRFFTPTRTLLLFISVTFGIEMAQFYELYDATYDPWDFAAYISLLVPLHLIDVWTR